MTPGNAIAYKGWLVRQCKCRKGKGGPGSFRVYVISEGNTDKLDETSLRHFLNVKQALQWVDAWDAGARVAPRGK